MKIDTAYFPTVEGSMNSDDGQTFMLHAKRPTGSGLLLGFPHSEIPNIIENAAMQTAHGKKLERPSNSDRAQNYFLSARQRAE